MWAEYKKTLEERQKWSRIIYELDKDGFYSNPNPQCETDDLSIDKQLLKKHLFVKPIDLIDFEINRLNELHKNNVEIDIKQFITLNNILGFEFLNQVLRIIDKNYVKQICSKKFNRIFYCVWNEKEIRRQATIRWKKLQRKRQRLKEQKEKMKQKEEMMKDPVYIAAKQLSLKKKQEEHEIWRKKLQFEKEIKQMKLKKKIKERKENPFGKWRKYPIIKSVRKARYKRIKKARDRMKAEEEAEESKLYYSSPEKYKEFIEIKALQKKEHAQKMKMFAAKRRKRLKYASWISPRYHIVPCLKKRKPKKYKNVYNIFIDKKRHFCECEGYEKILSSLYSNSQDIHQLPYCQHIMAVKIALVLNKVERIQVSEPVWSRRCIEHITNNIPESAY